MRSLRFQTTTQTSLAKTARMRDQVEDRSTCIQKLRERKIANEKTAIAFSSNKREDIITEENKTQGTKTIAEMKDDFDQDNHSRQKFKTGCFKVNFSLGNSQELIDYIPSSKQPDPTGSIGEFAVELSDETKSSIKKSSIYFGKDKPVYESISSSCNICHKNSVEFAALKAETKKLNNGQRNQNFSFGPKEQNDWTTNHKTDFILYTDTQQANARGELSEEVKDDLKRSHFDVGKRRKNTESSNNLNREADELNKMTKWNNNGWKKEEISKMKHNCRKANFSIGTDADYM
mmetsp:Transcript_42783/g.51368  ORF Transcript_42783/g.51368 Transcript_42783/m.51368 type:complete len:290 (+) Transcript_42783:92-961(+)|eukprot:CAMPEP_0194357380 /NCGR_PEP_ID=MMETSP0174-20130528/4863_1 /TAXON_ID=216777 /ORGANISM="Proboscia alata, Strain PI-D3" /LENGTH=289 /DNA_ID=CAMNT_0039127367 /DNA_START=88 /DNA_END=957 /DNA_ORIENTATION=+